jgi:hypothetical protein
MKRMRVVVSLLVLASCQTSPAPPVPTGTVTRSIGSFQGRGSQTIGVISESGRLHISWRTKNERPPGRGTFRLALHSAVSGRPLQLIVDTRGEGSGSADVAEDPRPYNFMVDSENLDWSFTVEEMVAAPVTH